MSWTVYSRAKFNSSRHHSRDGESRSFMMPKSTHLPALGMQERYPPPPPPNAIRAAKLAVRPQEKDTSIAPFPAVKPNSGLLYLPKNYMRSSSRRKADKWSELGLRAPPQELSPSPSETMKL
ncbi:hypothetical protein NEUTE2DRAFT_65730 [Neurospora tetrasperma FGSC 2509]|nr:hypothetical protein NEUTE2DRAFT_65730 [Neurospora tetrasperma FGSC 2509]